MKRNTRREQQDRGESEQSCRHSERGAALPVAVRPLNAATASSAATLDNSLVEQRRLPPCTRGGWMQTSRFARALLQSAATLRPRRSAPHPTRLLSAALLSLVCLRAQRHGRVAPEQLDSTRPRWQPDRSGRQAGPHGRSAGAGTRVGSHSHTRPHAGEWSSHSRQRCSRASLIRSHSLFLDALALPPFSTSSSGAASSAQDRSVGQVTIYSNGFIVGNSEFRDIKDPKNLQFLNDLKRG